MYSTVSKLLGLIGSIANIHDCEFQSGWIILWGHGVCAHKSEWHRKEPRHITSSVFRLQMEYLMGKGYRFISLNEGLSKLNCGEDTSKCVTLTFDDGFQNVIDIAYPIMIELGLKGTIFVVTELVESRRLLWTDSVDVICRYGLEMDITQRIASLPGACFRDHDDWADRAIQIKRILKRVSNKERLEVMQLVDKKIEIVGCNNIPSDFAIADLNGLRKLDPEILSIGNHSATHPQLTTLENEDELKSETLGSKRILENWFQRPVEHYCYPSGNLSDTVMNAILLSGHSSGCSVEYGVNRNGVNPYCLGRLLLPPRFEDFKLRSTGFENLLVKFRSKLMHR